MGTATSAMVTGWRGLVRRLGVMDDGGRGRRWRRRMNVARVVLTVGPALGCCTALEHLGPGLDRCSFTRQVFGLVVHGFILGYGVEGRSGRGSGRRCRSKHRVGSRRVFGVQI